MTPMDLIIWWTGASVLAAGAALAAVLTVGGLFVAIVVGITWVCQRVWNTHSNLRTAWEWKLAGKPVSLRHSAAGEKE